MDELFTVCVTHYNQMNFVYSALDSVLRQDYPSIELIVADDASEEFDKKAIEEYIKQNKGANIKKVQIIANKKNLGTVKNLNNVLKNATEEGTYAKEYTGEHNDSIDESKSTRKIYHWNAI